jgi:hypothetical protein
LWWLWVGFGNASTPSERKGAVGSGLQPPATGSHRKYH